MAGKGGGLEPDLEWSGQVGVEQSQTRGVVAGKGRTWRGAGPDADVGVEQGQTQSEEVGLR